MLIGHLPAGYLLSEAARSHSASGVMMTGILIGAVLLHWTFAVDTAVTLAALALLIRDPRRAPQ